MSEESREVSCGCIGSTAKDDILSGLALKRKDMEIRIIDMEKNRYSAQDIKLFKDWSNDISALMEKIRNIPQCD